MELLRHNCVTANKRVGAGGVGILRLFAKARQARSNIVNQLSADGTDGADG
jgi:hypothetical protein